MNLLARIVYTPKLMSLLTYAYQFGSIALRSICYPHYPNTRITPCGHAVAHSCVPLSWRAVRSKDSENVVVLVVQLLNLSEAT